MVAETNGAPSPLRSGGVAEGSFIPLGVLALCANDHGFNAARYAACPQCGEFDRIMVEKALSPEIFGKRIRAAFFSRKAKEGR